jgi:hypothetical protein
LASTICASRLASFERSRWALAGFTDGGGGGAVLPADWLTGIASSFDLSADRRVWLMLLFA